MSLVLRTALGRASWRLLHRPAVVYSRAQRSHSAPAATAAPLAPAPLGATGAVPQRQVPEVEPPPVVPYSSEASNFVVVSGQVLSEPKVRYLPANQVAASVRLGLRPRYTRPDASLAPLHGAVTVDAWGLLALQLAQHVHKGSRIQVQGVLKEDSWQDRASGEKRFMVKIVAEQLALLASPDSLQHQQDGSGMEQGLPPLPPTQPEPSSAPGWTAQPAAGMAQLPEKQAQQVQQAQQTAQQAAQQAAQQQQQQQQQAPAPRFSFSCEQSRRMYEEEGAELAAIAAARGLKLGTVIDHLLTAAEAGAFASWGRLAADVQLGPAAAAEAPGGGASWLTPAEVAEAIFLEQEASEGAELGRLRLGNIRRRLAEGPHTGGKVAQLEGRCQGDPVLTYACIKLVLRMLLQGISFGVVSSPPRDTLPVVPPPPVTQSPSQGPPPF